MICSSQLADDPSYNNIGLCHTSPITSGILWCQLIIHCCPQHYTPLLEQHSFIMTQNIQSLSWHYNRLLLQCIWL